MDNLTVTEKFDFSKIIEKPLKSGDENAPTRILFVCTGNTCRSPMAAAVLNALGKGKYKAFSAGTSAFNGDCISDDAVWALEDAGILSTEDNNYKSHLSRPITEELLKDCDKAIAISSRHLMALLYAFPAYADKISVMKKDISDPYMLGKDEYSNCLCEITECIKEMFSLCTNLFYVLQKKKILKLC